MINLSILFRLASEYLYYPSDRVCLYTNVGYISYGLTGLHMVLTELQTMYPTQACDFGLPDGISWNTFIQYVLVPEVVCVLISDDMHVTLVEAVRIWNESREFGLRAFPDELDDE